MDPRRRALILNVEDEAVVAAVDAAEGEGEAAICAAEDTEAVEAEDMEEDGDMAADMEAAGEVMDAVGEDTEEGLGEAAAEGLDLEEGDIRASSVTINRICRIPMSIREETVR